jgi:ribosome-binding protein aMBF1 (putative translation factor)
MSRKRTRNALTLIARDVGKNPAYWRMVEDETLNVQVARAIYDARTAAKLTQKQLAELAGTTQPVIARLEDADYNGHSLTTLRRIAEALGRRVEVRLVPKRRALQRA